MAFNQVAKYYQGYLKSVGKGYSVDSISQKIAGILNLALHGSIDISGICADYSGNVYVTDAIRHIVLRITEGGAIRVIAGQIGVSGNNGNATVTAAASLFNYPTGITCDKNGDLYVCDTNNNQIRRISNNKVSLVAGAAAGTAGTANGVGAVARFTTPYGIDIDYSGIIYVADTGNHSVRKIKGGVVSTLAGLSGTAGDYPQWVNMTTAVGVLGTLARFRSPYGITVNPNGYVFVLDTDNNVIKRIDPSGNVRIFSGQSGVYGRGQGTAKVCSFQYLRFADVTRSEEIYAIDYDETGASRIMVINREGAAYPVLYWNAGDEEGKCLAAIVCNPAAHIIVAESEYMNYEFSTSSSSSSTEYRSSSSSSESSSSSTQVRSSSSSSNSSSSNSSSSLSSESSSSLSSESSSSPSSESSSSPSSDSSSSNSSSSLSSESSSSNSSSSSTQIRSSSSSSSLSSESSSSSSSLSSESSSSSTQVRSSSLSSESSSSLSSESSSSLSSESSSSSSSLSSESSSSSSSYIANWSSSSSSSSLSSESSSSSSSYIANWSSSSSSSSLSSESSSSNSSSSSSSSSSSLQGCEPEYCASGFATTLLNGKYSWTGAYHNSKAVYNNGTYNLWYAAGVYTVWAISTTIGTAPIAWLSSKTTLVGCPDGTYDNESGIITTGDCSSGSSNSSSSSSRSNSSSSSESGPR